VRPTHRKTLAAVVVAASAFVLAACAPNTTQDPLQPAGEFARKSHDLFVPVFWIAAAVFFLVEGALIVFVWKYRHRPGRDEVPPQVHGNTRLEIAWTILPALILAGVAVPTVTTIFDLAREPTPATMQVNVLGHQWWWEFDYPDEGIVTANELHIPTGRAVYLTLCAVGYGNSGDNPQPMPSACQTGPPDSAPPTILGEGVIHSFWPPQLAGTQDVVPGQTNHLWIEADEPGTYQGQCKEFCGLSHAYMKFTVVAHTPEDYAAWVAEQQQPAAEPTGDAVAGRDAFLNAIPGGCVRCHAVDGLTDAQGQDVVGASDGPNLTHFNSRECFAGCILRNDSDEDLRRWLADPPAVKAGSWMPDYGLSDQQIDDLIAYLRTLN
jgi:cytochrome c oxidase subunit 2